MQLDLTQDELVLLEQSTRISLDRLGAAMDIIQAKYVEVGGVKPPYRGNDESDFCRYYRSHVHFQSIQQKVKETLLKF